MEFSTQTTASLHQIKTAALAVGVFADGVLSPAADLIDRAANGAVRAVAKTEFRGRAGATLTLRNLPGVTAQRVVLVGLGKQDEYSARAHATAEQAFAQACVAAQLAEGVSTLVTNPVADVPVIARARSAAIAAGAATYHYDASFGKPDRDARPKLKKIVQIVERADAAQAQKGLREGAAIANGMSLTRDLGNLPGNICTPTYLGETAKRLAREFKSLKVEVLDKKQVEALGMGSFLSVARGSDEPLRFIVLRHAGKPAKKGAKAGDGPIVLVGKGITFDAGGISLAGRHHGRNEVRHGRRRQRAGLVPRPGRTGTAAGRGRPDPGLREPAQRQGQQARRRGHQHVGPDHRDPQHRRRRPPGAVRRADLRRALQALDGHRHRHPHRRLRGGAGSRQHGPVLQGRRTGRGPGRRRSPGPGHRMAPAHGRRLPGPAQVQLRRHRQHRRPPAGAVTAACFLSRFTKAYRWAHLDIAGTAWKGGKDKGATGRPVPLLMQFLLGQA